MIQPGGTCSPLLIATNSLPSATVDVVTSRMTGSPPATGTPMVIGFVERRRSLPPNGATRWAPEVLRKCSETCPWPAASSAQSPTRPRCPQLRKPTIAMPVLAALRVPSAPAYSPTIWPKPRLPSTMAMASFSNATVGLALGTSHPARTHSRYLPTRITPCESWPTRFESTSRRATVAASLALLPPPCMIAVTSVTSFSAGTVFMVACGRPRRTGDGARVMDVLSVDLRLGGRRGSFEEIEVATLIGLRDVLLIKHPVAAHEPRGRLFPRGAARGELGVAHLELDLARCDVELDQVPVAHQRQRSAGERFRRDVQHAGTVAGPAHARVGNPDHV